MWNFHLHEAHHLMDIKQCTAFLDFHHHLECAIKYSRGKCVIVLATKKVGYFYLFNFHRLCTA
jgi:hypothetical protein